MNDLTLLKDYGPAPHALDPSILASARSALAAEIASAPRASRRPVRIFTPARFLAAALAPVLTIGLGSMWRDNGPTSSKSGPLTLVTFSMPQFPFLLDPMPDGLALSTIEKEKGWPGEPGFLGLGGTPPHPGMFYAHYHDTNDRDGVTLAVPDGPVDFKESVTDWLADDAEETTLRGRDALILRSEAIDGVTNEVIESVSLAWQPAGDQWVVLSGSGRYSTETSLREIAERVVDKPQPVSLEIGLAPAGWVVCCFKNGVVLTLEDPNDESRSLTVHLSDGMVPDFVNQVEGNNRRHQSVVVNGQAADLVLTENYDDSGTTRWILQAPVGDRVFGLQAPGDLTAEQVVQIAESVHLN